LSRIQGELVHEVDTTGLPIGRALKVERVTAGVTLGRIAEAVGVSAGHLSHIEAGRRTASPELVERIRVAIRAGRVA
jgi:transcriptional regulator with XRE-family HTH domain